MSIQSSVMNTFDWGENGVFCCKQAVAKQSIEKAERGPRIFATLRARTSVIHTISDTFNTSAVIECVTQLRVKGVQGECI